MALREGLHGDGDLGVAVGDPPPDTTTRPRDGAHAAAPKRYGLGLRLRPERALVDSVSSGRFSDLRWTGSAGLRPAHIRLINRRSRRGTPSVRWVLHADALAPPPRPFPLDTVIPYQGQVRADISGSAHR